MAARRKSHHVFPSLRGGWSVKKGGSLRASKHFDKKEDAVKWGRKLSKKHGSDFIIHRIDGTIERKDSYGPNSLPPKDRDTHK
jgi:hypothetical protein